MNLLLVNVQLIWIRSFDLLWPLPHEFCNRFLISTSWLPTSCWITVKVLIPLNHLKIRVRDSVLWTSKFRHFLCLYSCFTWVWTTY